jgi:hypothetical protein
MRHGILCEHASHRAHRDARTRRDIGLRVTRAEKNLNLVALQQ